MRLSTTDAHGTRRRTRDDIGGDVPAGGSTQGGSYGGSIGGQGGSAGGTTDEGLGSGKQNDADAVIYIAKGSLANFYVGAYSEGQVALYQRFDASNVARQPATDHYKTLTPGARSIREASDASNRKTASMASAAQGLWGNRR